MDPKINFLSLNVGMSSTLAGLSTLITTQNLDVVFLQEVKSSGEQIELLLGRLGFKAAVNIDQECPTTPGTAIVWRASLPVTDVSILVSCRAQVARLGHYMLLNIYAPSGSDRKYERNSFFGQEIFNSLQLGNKDMWVLGGDFNSVLSAQDVEGGVGVNQKLCPALKDLVRTFNLCDVFRYTFPRCEEYTFFRAGSAASRLDRFYISSSLKNNLQGAEHIASLSDHCAVKMSLGLDLEFRSLPKEERKRV